MRPRFTQRLRLAAQVTRGLFMTDPKRTVMGRIAQMLMRFTWELPQTIFGWFYTLGRVFAGRVDRVDVTGGITFATCSHSSKWMGVSLGTFVDLWAPYELNEKNDDYVTSIHLFMHEFGHTADSKRFGWAYLPVIGLSSLMSALGKGDHSTYWTEIRANGHAKRYFSKHYAINWDDSRYPSEKLT